MAVVSLHPAPRDHRALCRHSALRAGTLARLTVAGELDLATIDGLRATCDALPLDGVVTLSVDLTELEFMDATGVGWLVELHRRASSGGVGVMVLVEVDGLVARLLAMTGVDERIVVHAERSATPGSSTRWPVRRLASVPRRAGAAR